MPDNNTPLDQIPDSIRSEAAVKFRDLANVLYTVAGAANIGKNSLKPLQLYAKTGDSLVKKIKDLDQKVQAVEKAANYLDNKPLVGPIAKAENFPGRGRCLGGCGRGVTTDRHAGWHRGCR